MIAQPPEEPVEELPGTAFGSLVESFGRGWERGDAAGIAGVFAEDGAFYPSPFDPPVQGREAIEEYWLDVPREQAEIVFRFGEVFRAGPWFAAEYRCTFRRRRTGEAVDVRGALFCETVDGLIGEMRMYWHRTVAGR